jgi:hypothetical protein
LFFELPIAYCLLPLFNLKLETRNLGKFLLALAIIILLGAKTLGPTAPKPVSPLQSNKFQPRTKGPVLFRHQPHEAAGLDCTACHHDVTNGRNVWRQGLSVQKCEDCHQVQPRSGRLDLKNAFHRQCKGCHLKTRQRGAAAGPVKCQECHRPG